MNTVESYMSSSPDDQTYYEDLESKHELLLLDMASIELEKLRDSSVAVGATAYFPRACLQLLKAIPGNLRCVDCNAANPEWASVSYGCLLCLECSGRHRSLGVRKSQVRSIHMDHWSHSQIISVLEGGNEQLSTFFDRHCLSPMSPKLQQISDFWREEDAVDLHPCPVASITTLRYMTKAALFYREELPRHVAKIISRGRYMGRNATRINRIQHKK